MRVLLLLALIVPTASAWSVSIDAPAAAGEGLPFLVDVCGEGEGAAQVRVLAENATLDVREDRYLPAFDGRACHEVEVRPTNGTVRLEARIRPEGRDLKARGFANVTLLDVPVSVTRDGRVLDLRAPIIDGWALVPALPGAQVPAPAELHLLEARAPPQEGVLIQNRGPGSVALAPFRIDGQPLPPVLLGAGETTFVALRVRMGELRLTAAEQVLDVLTVPKLRSGEGTLGRYGRTHISAESAPVQGRILAYATPGAGVAPVVDLIDTAREDVLVEGYTLTSSDITAALLRALDRGARVRVLLEGAPVGGVPAEEGALVATLVARGAEVDALGGAGARYRTVHSKLIVADRRAISISTENFNEAHARGFGLIIENATLAERVAAFIEADLLGHDVARFPLSVPPGAALPTAGRASAGSRALEGTWNTTLVLSPDDPLAIARLIAGATQRVDVAMLRAEPEGPMIDALLAAARNGARVRLLLDGRFDDGVNRETAARLDALAEREGLDLDARLDRPERTLHAKAVAVDGRAVYVGSMNWVRAAIEDNREAGVMVESEALAQWLQEEMEREWAEPREVREVAAPPMGWTVIALAISVRGMRPSRASSRCACLRGGA